MTLTPSTETPACTTCHTPTSRYGKHRNGLQRFRCAACGKTATAQHSRLFGTMTVDEDKALLAVQLLLEGNSIRSTERVCGIDRNTIMRLLVVAGERCNRLMTERVRNVQVEHLELDEVWTYVGCHQKFVKPDAENPRQRGDQYVFIALEEKTKMVMAWHLGKRDMFNTQQFIGKVRRATSAANLFDVSTDAFPAYDRAIDGGLYDRANHAQIVKLFSHHVEEGRERYSPAKFVAVAKDVVSGMPDLDRATTSHVERKNGTLRQWCKRMTRLTYAYSKKWEHLNVALALHFAYYSFCRVHSSLRVTPCMEAKITDRIWTLRELLTAVESAA